MEAQAFQRIIGSRTLITAPGRYTVKVSNCGDFVKSVNGTNIVAIANFSAMTPYQVEQAKAKYFGGDPAAALNQNLSFTIRDTDYRPAKGERIDIDVDYVTTKSGEKALLVVGLVPIQAKSAGKVNFSAFLTEEEIAEAQAASEGGLQ